MAGAATPGRAGGWRRRESARCRSWRRVCCRAFDRSSIGLAPNQTQPSSFKRQRSRSRLTAEGKGLAPLTRRSCENGSRHEFSPPPRSPSTTLDLQPGKLLAAAVLPSCLTDLTVAMLQEQHAEEKVIDMILDVATKYIFECRLPGQWGLHSRYSLRGKAVGGPRKFKSCDDVAAASSIRDQHPKGGVSP